MLQWASLPVGHTHEDIDQRFFPISNILRCHDALTTDELMEYARTAWRKALPDGQIVEVKELGAVRHFKSVLHPKTGKIPDGIMEEFSGFGSVSYNNAKEVSRCNHNFKFSMESGNAVLHYREWTSEVGDNKWFGKDAKQGWAMFKEDPDTARTPAQIPRTMPPYFLEVYSKINKLMGDWHLYVKEAAKAPEKKLPWYVLLVGPLSAMYWLADLI